MISNAKIKEAGFRLGFSRVGVCDASPSAHLTFYRRWLAKGYHGTMAYMAAQAPLKAHPRNLLPDARSVIAVSLNYNRLNPSVDGYPRIARYALGRDYHKVLRKKLRALAGQLKREYPEAQFRPCVDSAPILEREYAHLAGLGWFGKNTCLIDSRTGSWFFIGLLLTTLEIEPESPSLGGCGICRRCIEACPTGAIVFEEDRWQVDSRRCISYLTIEHRGTIDHIYEPAMKDWTFGCDICQEVCPFNEQRPSQPERAAITQEADFLASRSWPSLKELADLSYSEWDELTRGSAMRRTRYEGLQRNARIQLKKND